MFKYPWGNLQGLNLAWFLEKFNQLLEDWATAEAGIDGALDDEIQKAEDALSDVFDARDAAAASATAAAGSATTATTSANFAGNSASVAAASASAAQTAAVNAAASETAAGNSASAAAGSATNASNAATQAGNSASAAAASAASIEGDVDAAAASASAAAGSATAAAGSATAAAGSATDAENAAASVTASAQQIATNTSDISSLKPVDISNNYTLDETNYTITAKSIIKFGDFIFYSIRAISKSTAVAARIWSNMPVAGTTGVNGDAWQRSAQTAIGYESDISASEVVASSIGDKILRVHNVKADWHYELTGFFKHNLT